MNNKEIKDLLDIIRTMAEQLYEARKKIVLLQAHLIIVEKVIGIDEKFLPPIEWLGDEEDD